MVKNYLLDTNVLLQNPDSIFGFDDNHVWICGTTLQELDGKKTAFGELGYAARQCCRNLDDLRMKGDLVKGVPLPHGGKLTIEPDGVDQKLLPAGFSITVPDNRIISSCLSLNQGRLKRNHVILVTNDISMRINASACGLKVEGYRNDHVEDDKSEYTGCADLSVSEELFSTLYEDQAVSVPEGAAFLENEFVKVHFEDNEALTIHENGQLLLIHEQTLFGWVRPMNAAQTCAMYALTAPVEEIPLVILIGPAGTAKTFLSLAAGLSQTCLGQSRKNSYGKYRRIVISRPNVTTQEKDFGYLPGDMKEKTSFLLNNYYDNLCSLLDGAEKGKDKATQGQKKIDQMLDSGVLEICPLNYIRGRSLTDSYIICDEAQNASRSLVRDIITRAGRHSKVILAGDINQVDASSLDSRNNGLITAMEMMKGHLCAIVRFSDHDCVRSPLAEAAIQYMKW
ncbi:MAG: PhoH family protein [Bulleidia sp.]|nr:PhoH family protein [Bulleidia sp.]